MKMNSCYKYECYHVGRSDMWGWYCPDTGEYYLAANDTDPVAGECISVLATAQEMPDGSWQEYTDCGYSYEVTRELLQLGHLTPKTLASFIEADGEVWWDQPNYSKEI